MTRTRVLTATATAAAVAILLLLLVRPRAEDPRSRNPPPPVPSQSPEQGVPADSPPRRSLLLVRVTALGTWDTSACVAVEIVNHGKRTRVSCAVNGAPVPVRGLSAGQAVVSAVCADECGEVNARLRRECEWPPPTRIDLQDDASPRTVAISFERAPGPDSAELVILTRTTDNQPVQGVATSVYSVSAAPRVEFKIVEGSSDSRGEVSCGNLGPGFYRIFVSEWPSDLSFVTNRDFVLPLREGQRREVRFDFERGGSLNIRFLGPPDIEPPHPVALYRADNGLWPYQATDVQPGQMLDLSLPAGRYYVAVWTPGLRRTSEFFDIRPGQRTEVVLRLERGGVAVRGRLLDARGSPVPNTRINLNTIPVGEGLVAGQGVKSDDDGHFVWQGVDPGHYHIVHWKGGLVRAVAVVAGDGDVDLGSLRCPSVSGTLTIGGTVRRGDGSAVTPGGVWVALSSPLLDGWWRVVVTSGNGEFAFGDVAPGEYTLWVEPGPVFGGFKRPAPARVRIGSEDRTVELAMP